MKFSLPHVVVFFVVGGGVLFGGQAAITRTVDAWSPTGPSSYSPERVNASASSSSAVVTPEIPTLTDLQKLTLQNRVLAVQLAHAQLDAVVHELTIPGYVLDLVQLSYQKKADAPVTP